MTEMQVRYNKPTITKALRTSGIKRNTQSWSDYERAKDILFKNNVVSDESYNFAIKIITDYIGI